MALLDAYRSALSSVAGQPSGLSGLSAGLSTAVGALETAAERRRKKQEEERAREREGLTFALNQAVEAGDVQGAQNIIENLYPGVDKEAFGLAVTKQKEEKDRAKRQDRLDKILASMKYVTDSAALARLGNEAGRLQAEILGVPETITRKTGQMVPSPTETETYTEQVPVPGTEFKAGAMLPVEQARQMAAERGLGGAFAPAFGPYAGGLEQRRVLKDIPALTTTKESTRPKMVEETETVPQFTFGQAVGTMTPVVTARMRPIYSEQTRLLKELDNKFSAIPVQNREEFRDEKVALDAEIRSVTAQALANEGVIPEGAKWPTIRFSREVETTKEREQGARLQLLRKRSTLADVQTEVARVRKEAIPKQAAAAWRRADAAMISANASQARAETAAEAVLVRKGDAASRRAFETWRNQEVNKRKLADIDKRADDESEKQAEIRYPKKDIQDLPDNERSAAIRARDAYRAGLKKAYLARDVVKALEENPPEPATTAPKVKAVGGAKPAPAKPAAPKPVPAPQRRAAPTTSSGAGAFSGLPGARQ